AQVVDQSFLESGQDGTVEIRNRNVVKDSRGDLIAMGRNVTIAVVDKDGADLAPPKVIYGAGIQVDEDDKVERGRRMSDWDPYTRPILTEVGGVVEIEDLVEGVSVNEQLDEATHITQRVVIDWRSNPRGGDLHPALVIRGDDGEILNVERGGEARYSLPVDAIISVEPGTRVNAGDALARIPTDSAKTRDITGGLPRVAELFEARRPKDHAIIAEIDGRIAFGRDYKNKRRITIVPDDASQEPAEYLIQKSKHLQVQEGDYVEKGEYILDGNPAPHDILAIKGVEELAAYLVYEIQEVYRLQGVHISDKHIEVIVRQMLQNVEVKSGGDTHLLTGEQVEKAIYEAANEKVLAKGGTPAVATPLLLGITKAALQTRSFISAASFQETTRVLTEAAVHGKVDHLEGLKENVIVGRLIPAGTGSMIARLRQVSNHRDSLILKERARVAAKLKADAETALIASQVEAAAAEEVAVADVAPVAEEPDQTSGEVPQEGATPDV
ncbi:MAG: DNA-directed RNA polymerase subunit beta', partial [Hyphomicrobiales bacterium]